MSCEADGTLQVLGQMVWGSNLRAPWLHGTGVLGLFRKQVSRAVVITTVTHQLSWLTSTRLTLHVHSHQTVTTVV